MKKEDCLAADWYQIGFEDGSKGYQASRIAKHRKACAQYTVAPDLQSYMDGRDAGLVEFCTPYNGYRLGTGGRSYKNQCLGIAEGPFLEAYNRGRDIFHFKQDIAKEKQNLEKLKTQLKQTQIQISDQEKALSEKCTDQEKCQTALDDIRALDTEKSRLRYYISEKEDQISSMDDTLRKMENKNRLY